MSDATVSASPASVGQDAREKLRAVEEWLERQPRHTLAILVGQYAINLRLRGCPICCNVSFDDALAALQYDVREMKKISRIVALTRRAKKFTDAIEAGRPLPVRRRKRKQRRRGAKATA